MGRGTCGDRKLPGDQNMKQPTSSTLDALLTAPILECCRVSLAAQTELDEIDNDSTVCEYSAEPELHRLVKVGSEWRRILP